MFIKSNKFEKIVEIIKIIFQKKMTVRINLKFNNIKNN